MFKAKFLIGLTSIFFAFILSFSLGKIEGNRLSEKASDELLIRNENQIQFLENLLYSATSTLDDVAVSYNNQCTDDFVKSLRAPIFNINGAIEIGIVDILEGSGLISCSSWGKVNIKTRPPVPAEGFFLSGPHTSNMLNQKIYVLKKTTDKNEFNILIKLSSVKNLLQDITLSRSDKPEPDIRIDEKRITSEYVNNINYTFQYKAKKEASYIFYASIFILSFLLFNFVIIPLIVFFIKREKIRNSISNNAIFNVYQPIIDSDNGKIFSYEVFTRTKNINNALALMGELKKFNLLSEHAVKQITSIEKESDHFLCNVFQINLSSSQLLNKKVLHKLHSMNETFRKNAIIEITEDEDLFLNRSYIQSEMQNLKSIGYRFALDDFGSGFSNFSYLFEFDFDFVKIDKSVLKSKNKNLIKNVINIINDLNIPCIAEGIESDKEREILADTPIKYHQGWLYGKAERAPEK